MIRFIKKIIKGDNSSLQPFSLLDDDLTLNDQPFTASGEVGIYSFKNHNITINSGSFIKADDTIDFKNRGQITIKGIGASKITFINSNNNSNDCIINANTRTSLENVVFAGDGQAKDIQITGGVYYTDNNNTNKYRNPLVTLKGCTVNSINIETLYNESNTVYFLTYDENTKGPESQNGKIDVYFPENLNPASTYKICDNNPSELFICRNNGGCGINSDGTGQLGVHFFYTSPYFSELNVNNEYQGYGSLHDSYSVNDSKILNVYYSGNTSSSLRQDYSTIIPDGCSLEMNMYNQMGLYYQNKTLPFFDVQKGGTLKIFGNGTDNHFALNANVDKPEGYFLKTNGTTELQNFNIYTDTNKRHIIVEGGTLTLDGVKFKDKYGHNLNQFIDDKLPATYDNVRQVNINGMSVKCSGTVILKNTCCIKNIEVIDTDENITDTTKAVLEIESGFTNEDLIPIVITVNLDAEAKQKLISSGKPFLKCPSNKNINDYIIWSNSESIPGLEGTPSGGYIYYYIRS